MDFNKIINSNKQNIKKIIRLITREDNEDLEQEVYIKILENSQKYEEKGAAKSWVSMIAKNASLDYLKSAYYKVFSTANTDEYSLQSLQDKKISPEEKIINIERQRRIINAINSLKPKFKEVIIMTEIDGYSYEECAQRLRCPLGTVKSRIFNAKKELSIQLEDLL